MRRVPWRLIGPPLVLAGACVWLGTRLLAVPDGPGSPVSPDAGLRAQHQIAQLLLREAGLSSQSEPVILTAAELEALLARHVRIGELPAAPRVRIHAEAIEVGGPVPLGRLLDRSPRGWGRRLVPAPVRDLPLWLALGGRILVRQGRGELSIERAAVGRQPVPVAWLRGLLGPRLPDGLGWRLPRVVERIDLEPGRIVIHTRPPTGPPRVPAARPG